MHLVVCVHAIVDPEIPASRFDVDPVTGRARAGDGPMVMGPYDENALECALKVRDAQPDTLVTALAHGEEGTEEILRRALAVGATDAALVPGPAGERDAFAVARVLAAAIGELGEVDAVLMGLEGGEWDTRQTPPALAEALGWPLVSPVAAVEASPPGGFRLRRMLEAETQWVAAPRPVAVAVTNDGTNALRMARVRDVLASRRRPIVALSGASRADVPAAVRTEGVALAPKSAGTCVLLEGPTGEARGRALAQRLVSERIL